MKSLYLLLVVTSLAVVSCASQKEMKSADDEFYSVDADDYFIEEDMMSEDVVGTEASGILKGTTSEMGSYQVQKGDTLMFISFKIYGDYAKWREILAQNPTLRISKLPVGKVLQYSEPDVKFTWQKSGMSYSIVPGDTLGKISKKIYRTSAKWRSLYENNRQMIKNPNLIFAGFTLYYKDSQQLGKLSIVTK